MYVSVSVRVWGCLTPQALQLVSRKVESFRAKFWALRVFIGLYLQP